MTTYTAFLHDAVLATGSQDRLVEVLRAAPALERASDLLVFDDKTGAQIDFDLRDRPSTASPRPRGRPSLGVVPREVTLLPRHWEWLAEQPGGASATIRRLVDAARTAEGDGQLRRNAAYRFLSVMAGDRPGYEEAIRALYADDRAGFEARSTGWPAAIRNHAARLAWPGPVGSASAD